MPTIKNTGPGGVGPLQILGTSVAATSSTGEGTRMIFARPLSNWSLQVEGPSTNLIVALQLGNISTGALTNAGSWASTDSLTSGQTLFVSGKPGSVVTATILQGASSNGVRAYVSATP